MALINLGNERLFPSDLVDEILTWSCESSIQRSFVLASVCRLWYDRFRAADRLWPLLAKSITRFRVAPRTATYAKVVRAWQQSTALKPHREATLHPIEDCSLEFRCPIYSEALSEVAPGVSFCSVCNENVYWVRSREELASLESSKKGRLCVQYNRADVAPEAVNNTVAVRIAVVTPDENSARHIAALLSEAGREAAASKGLSGMTSTTSPIVLYQYITPSVFPHYILRLASTVSPFVRVTFLTREEAATCTTVARKPAEGGGDVLVPFQGFSFAFVLSSEFSDGDANSNSAANDQDILINEANRCGVELGADFDIALKTRGIPLMSSKEKLVRKLLSTVRSVHESPVIRGMRVR